MATFVGIDAGGKVWLVSESSSGSALPTHFNGISLTAVELTVQQEEELRSLPARRGTIFSGGSFTAIDSEPAAPKPVPLATANWIRDSHWHFVPAEQMAFSTSNGGGKSLNPANTLWWHGPGAGASTNVTFNQAIHGQWEGNPERFMRIEWTIAPSAGDLVYTPTFRFTFLEHWINTARILAGKQVTVSWQLRSTGPVPVIPIIWRSVPNMPADMKLHPDVDAQIFTGPTFNLTQYVQRCDFTMTLPPIQAGLDITASSYLGVGLDIPGQYGPTIDIGPSRLNEGGPQPFEEEPYWYQKLMATQAYP